MAKLWANDDVWIAKLKRNLQYGSYDKPEYTLFTITLSNSSYTLPSLYKHCNQCISLPCHVNPTNQKQIM